jgi:hypothetical protein
MATLDSLPNDILSQCFSHLARSNAHVNIQNIRLVSRKFCDVSSRFLLTSFSFSFTSQSLLDLEQAAQHPVFSKSIKKLNANVSYYDEQLVQNLRSFVRGIHRVLDRDSRLIHSPKGSVDLSKHRMPAVLLAMAQLSHVLKPAAAERAEKDIGVISEAHSRYACLYEDQRKLTVNGACIDRLIVILNGFAALEEILIEDTRTTPGPEWSREGTHA